MAELNKIDLGKYFDGDPRKIEEFIKYIDAFKEGINSIDAVLKRNKDQVSVYAREVQADLRKIKSPTLENIELFGKVEAGYMRLGETMKRISQLEKDLADARKATAQVNIEAMKAARIAAEEVREANRKAAAEAKQQAKEQSEAAKKAARETAAAEKQKQKEILATQQTLEGLRAKLSLLTEKRNKLNIEIDPAQYKQVQDDIKNLNDQIKGIEQGGGDFRRKVGDYENSIKNALGDFFKSGDTSGLESFIGANTAKFAAFTGGALAAAAAALEFLKATEKSNKEVALAGSITGLTGEKLDQLAGSVQATAEKFGQEYNDVLTAANALSKQMGISASEAIDLINEGFTEGADLQGNFLDVIKEYPATFKESGLSAREFIKITTQSVKGGIYDDKLIDALKNMQIELRDTEKVTKVFQGTFSNEFTTRFTSGIKDGSIRVKEALQLIDQEGKKVGLNFEQIQKITSDIFTGAGEDAGGYREILQQVNTALQNQNNTLTETQKRTIEATKANADFNAEFNKLAKNFEGIGERSSVFFNQTLTAITSALNKLINPVSEVSALFEKQSEVVKNLENNINPLLDRYDALKAKTSPNKAEQEELRKVIVGIGEAIPGAITQIDQYGNALEINAAKARAFITRNLKINEELRGTLLTAEKARLENAQREIRILQKEIEEGSKYEITLFGDITGADRNKKLTEEDYKNNASRIAELSAQAAALRENIKALENSADTTTKEIVTKTKTAEQEQQAKNFEYLKYELEQKIKTNQAKIDAEQSYLFEEFDLQQQNMKLKRQIAQLEYEQEISAEKVSHDQKLLARAKFRDQLIEIDKEYVAQERALLQVLNAEEIRQIQATDRLDKDIKKQREDMARPKIAKYDYAAGIDQTAKMDAEKVKNKMLQGLIDKRTYEESLRAIEKGTLQFKLDNAEKLKLSEIEVLQIKNRILEIDKDSAKNVFDRLNDSAAKLRDTLGEAFTALFGEKQGKKIEAIAKLIAAAGAVVSPAGSNANAIFAGISGLNVKKFAEGVIDLEGGERGKDSIPALLMPGESVMTTEETRRFKPLLAGIREGEIKSMNDLLKPLPLAQVPPALLQPVIAQFDTTGLERKLDSLEKTVRESRQNNDLFFDSTAKQFVRIEEKFNQLNKYIYAQKGRTPSIRD